MRADLRMNHSKDSHGSPPASASYGIDGLAASMLIAAVVATPIGGSGAAPVAQMPSWLEVAGVALVIAGVAVHRDRDE